MCVDYFRVATQTLGVTRTMLLHSITFSLSLIFNPKFCLQNAYLMPENELIMIAKTATYNDIVSINKCSCECFFSSHTYGICYVYSVSIVYTFLIRAICKCMPACEFLINISYFMMLGFLVEKKKLNKWSVFSCYMLLYMFEFRSWYMLNFSLYMCTIVNNKIQSIMRHFALHAFAIPYWARNIIPRHIK